MQIKIKALRMKEHRTECYSSACRKNEKTPAARERGSAEPPAIWRHWRPLRWSRVRDTGGPEAVDNAMTTRHTSGIASLCPWLAIASAILDMIEDKTSLGCRLLKPSQKEPTIDCEQVVGRSAKTQAVVADCVTKQAGADN